MQTCTRVLVELCAERGSIAGVLGFSRGAKLRTGLRLTSSILAVDFPAVTGVPPGFPPIIIIGGIIGPYVPGGTPCIGTGTEPLPEDDGPTP